MPKKTKSKKNLIAKKPARKAPKKIAKKTVAKKPAVNKKSIRQAQNKPIGRVTHFYTHIKVAIVKFKQPIKVGAKLRFEGATTKFEDKILSMQFDHKAIKLAPKGKEIGLKVKKRAREGDVVYLVK